MCHIGVFDVLYLSARCVILEYSMCHIGVFGVLYLSARCVILECSVCKIECSMC